MSDSVVINIVEVSDSIEVDVTEQNQLDVNITNNPLWGDIAGTLSDQTDLQSELDAKEDVANKVIAFQATPDNTHYPSEKLVKDNLDLKMDKFSADYLDFDLEDGFPMQEGRLQWDADSGTLMFGLPGGNVNLQIGQEHVSRVYNDSGADIPNGTPVAFAGAFSQWAKVIPADNSAYATALCVGLATETIQDGHFGFITLSGIVRDIDTNNLVEGAPVWLGTSGQMTSVRPTSPNFQVLLGACINKGSGNGKIAVFLDLFKRLSYLSDVLINNLENGNILYWDTDTWKNSPKTRITPEGGIAVKLTNKTGSASIKGYCVTASDDFDNAVQLVPIGDPDCMGIVYESGIADGDEMWVITNGIAEVYFWDSTTHGHLARTGLASDTGEVSGQAFSEPIPSPPFASDKHFCEIGHVLESRTGPGLAKVNLHFN